MREYRKRKLLEEDNYNNVPKQTKLNAERQREYRETYIFFRGPVTLNRAEHRA
jgi:hypothetical protein